MNRIWKSWWELMLDRWRLRLRYYAHRRMVRRHDRFRPISYDHLTDADYLHAAIGLDRGECFGPCPVYSLTVSGDGRVIFFGGKNCEAEGEHTAQIDPAEVRKLIQEFYRINFFAMNASYQTFETDGPTYGLWIHIQGKDKYSIDHGGGPMRLARLSDKVDRVAQTIQWTIDNGQLTIELF